ncbi:nose resistant to fluoxetine protein 6-like [Dermacentor silvarum]|uniref:nose resistant to fluoxetine protein 6-like n=1 Tax=Dermacentor silvarum TaxID=543639 RepID=UPI00210192C3|nr:nose resistant to fluoxetine protein 6-like [Dermacentor silvarum]
MGPKVRCCLTVLAVWAMLLLCFSLWIQKCGADSSLSAAPEKLRTEDTNGEETMLAGGHPRVDDGGNETEIDVGRRLWKDQEGRLKAGIESFFKMLFPRLVRLGSEAEISTECQAAYFKMFVAIRQLKTWALQMVDSSGKIPNGVMSGTAASFGHFDQCLGITVEGDAFRGKFCNLELWLRDLPRPSANAADIIEDRESVLTFFYDNGYWLQLFPARMGVCIPSTCSGEDLQKMAAKASQEFQITANVTSCQVKEPINFSQEQLLVLCILGVLLLLAIVGTALDALCTQDVKQTATVGGRLVEALASFSLVRNTRSLFSRSEHATGPLEALNGIRVISCFWIVLGHIYFLTDLSTYIRFASLTKLQVLFKDFLFTLVENFTLPVDTFFFITGLLLTYNQTKKSQQMKSSASLWNMISTVFHRYWRMTPAFGLATALFVLMPAFGSGPMWRDVLGLATENCRLYWWSNLLYFSNYLPYSKMCMLHSWFLSLNMQYFVVGLPLALVMFRKPKLTLLALMALVIASCLITGAVTYMNELPPAMLMMTARWSKAKQLLNMVYYQPFTHFGPFAVGLCFGYALPTVKVPRFRKVTLAAGWLMAIVLCGSAVFVAYPFRRGDTAFHPLLSAVYAGCHRTLWTVGVAWVTVLCATRQAGLVGEMLSSSVMTPLSRLSYLVFLLHPVPIYVHVASVRESFQLDHYYMCTLYFGILVTSILMAYVAYLTVEAPFAALERLMRSPPKAASSRVQTPMTTLTMEPPPQQQQQQQQHKAAEGWRSPPRSAPAATSAALNGGNSTLTLAIAKTPESSHL